MRTLQAKTQKPLKKASTQMHFASHVAFNALYDVPQLLATAQVPECIVEVMRVSSMTALLKPNGRIRGIAAADSFRRLVAKTLARQKQDELRNAVWPYNFGLSNTSGTDTAVHFLQYLSDQYPDEVI